MNYLPVKKGFLGKVSISVYHLLDNVFRQRYFVNFELFYRNIRNSGTLSNEDLDFVKTRMEEADFFSFRNYNNNVLQHLSREEFLPLQNLVKNKSIVIQKSDKGSSVVIVDKTVYLDKMENLLNDTHKL